MSGAPQYDCSERPIGQAIKKLTEAVINSSTADEKLKNELMEQLGFLAEQATLPKAQRQGSVVAMVLKSMPSSLAFAANITTVWTRWGNTLIEFFK
jgi:hypothetical protein